MPFSLSASCVFRSLVWAQDWDYPGGAPADRAPNRPLIATKAALAAWAQDWAQDWPQGLGKANVGIVAVG